MLWAISWMFSEVRITRMRKGQWNPEAAEGA